jgi:hypothetical protein
MVLILNGPHHQGAGLNSLMVLIIKALSSSLMVLIIKALASIH